MCRLSFAAICIAATLGLCPIFAWLQERSMRAFAWWGSAYMIGAYSMALWSEPPSATMCCACSRRRCALITERICANLEISGVMVGEHAIGATVSIGVAVACAPVIEVGPLLVCADAALYRAKRDGRNRVCAVGKESVAAARHWVESVEPTHILHPMVFFDGVA